MAGPLKYQQLDQASSDFRLLTLAPVEDQTEPVSCTLEIYSLADSPPYHALSYVWGDVEDTVDIKVNGAKFRATRNLEKALRAVRLRLDDPKDPVTSTLATTSDAASAVASMSSPAWDGSYRLWVDALCINQLDSAERDAQVLRMGDIYSRSVATVVWLGEAADRSDVAFALIEILSMRDKHPQYKEVIELENNNYKYLWIALAHLLERDYWTRCWVLQEIALAKDVWFLCGTDFADLHSMYSALFGARYHHENVLGEYGYPGARKQMPNSTMLKTCMKLYLKKLRADDRPKKQESEQASDHETESGSEQDEGNRVKKSSNDLDRYDLITSLPYIISERISARLQSAMLHDQVFSLLGLCHDAASLIPQPSYQTPFRVVMRDMYQRLAERTSSLDWIRLSGGNEPLRESTCEVSNAHSVDTVAKSHAALVDNAQKYKQAATHYETIQQERAQSLWPSWLPDNCKGFGEGNGNAVVEGCLYRATKNRDADFVFKESVLSCRGIIFDAILPPSYSTDEVTEEDTEEDTDGSTDQDKNEVTEEDTDKEEAAEFPNPYRDEAATFEAIWQATTQYPGLEKTTDHQPSDLAWTFAEYWNSKWDDVQVAVKDPEDEPTGQVQKIFAAMSVGGKAGHVDPVWPHEAFYSPLSSLPPERLDPGECARRFGLLHDQKNLLVHGLTLHDWVRFRTVKWAFEWGLYEGNTGLKEHMRYKKLEGLGDSMIKALIDLMDQGAAFMVKRMWVTYRRGLEYIKCVPSSNELFLTEKGYIGGRFKYFSQKPGDKLALLFGCNFPVILRPRPEGEGYTFIGEAYVHGIMQGEACGQEHDDEVQWIDIY